MRQRSGFPSLVSRPMNIIQAQEVYNHPISLKINTDVPLRELCDSQLLHMEELSSINHIKRSRSLGATDSKDLVPRFKSTLASDIELSIFSNENQTNLKLAVENPNQLQSRTLMELVKIILERVVEGIRYCEPGAKVIKTNFLLIELVRIDIAMC